jgi:hypothetical protein
MTGRARGTMGNQMLHARTLPDGPLGRRGRFTGGGRPHIGQPANDNTPPARYLIGRALRTLWIATLLAGAAAGLVHILG